MQHSFGKENFVLLARDFSSQVFWNVGLVQKTFRKVYSAVRACIPKSDTSGSIPWDQPCPTRISCLQHWNLSICYIEKLDSCEIDDGTVAPIHTRTGREFLMCKFFILVMGHMEQTRKRIWDRERVKNTEEVVPHTIPLGELFIGRPVNLCDSLLGGLLHRRSDLLLPQHCHHLQCSRPCCPIPRCSSAVTNRLTQKLGLAYCSTPCHGCHSSLVRCVAMCCTIPLCVKLRTQNSAVMKIMASESNTQVDESPCYLVNIAGWQNAAKP